MKFSLVHILIPAGIVLACSTLSAQAPVSPATATVSFPANSEALSPDGRYAIVDIDRSSEPYHVVFLKNLQVNSRRELFDYDRHVDVLWSPDSKSFAVTDYGDSDFSRCNIFSVDEKIARIPVLDHLFRTLPESEQKRLKRLQSNHHFYVAASAWTGPKELRLKIWGYGDADPKGFTRYYALQLPSQP